MTECVFCGAEVTVRDDVCTDQGRLCAECHVTRW
jgi:hypothetical protein